MPAQNRVIAFQRWVPGVGRDVIVVASLNNHSFRNKSYRLGFPSGGHWHEVFNSDIYDNYFNPNVQGNYGGVTADGPAWDDLPTSANITLPVNSILVFARDTGDDPVGSSARVSAPPLAYPILLGRRLQRFLAGKSERLAAPKAAVFMNVRRVGKSMMITLVVGNDLVGGPAGRECFAEAVKIFGGQLGPRYDLTQLQFEYFVVLDVVVYPVTT